MPYPDTDYTLYSKRGCIGYRFAVLEIKTIASVLLSKFDFAPAGTPITVRTNIVMRPMVENHLEDGAQLPLLVRKVA